MFHDDALEWLARSVGIDPGRLEITQMKGSTSSSVYLIQSDAGEGSERCVLRVLDNRAWLAQEPDLAAHEAAALEKANGAGLRAPKLVAYSSDEVGFGGPVVLMSFIDGKIDLQPRDFKNWLDRLASELAEIHRQEADAFPWRYRSWVEKESLAVPYWTSNPRLWGRAVRLVSGTAPAARQVFLHRDFHPANLLWREEAVTGVVDWINACRGPAGVDVAHCRTNLALMYGPAASEQFLASYVDVADGFDYHPYWDVDSILNSCAPEPSFYAPWQEFGLSLIPPEVLMHRADAHLEWVMSRA